MSGAEERAEREEGPPLTESLSKWLPAGLSQAKSQEPPTLSHSPSAWTRSCCFPGHMSRELEQRQSPRNSNRHSSMRCQHHRQQLSPLHHRAGPVSTRDALYIMRSRGAQHLFVYGLAVCACSWQESMLEPPAHFSRVPCMFWRLPPCQMNSFTFSFPSLPFPPVGLSLYWTESF